MIAEFKFKGSGDTVQLSISPENDSEVVAMKLFQQENMVDCGDAHNIIFDFSETDLG